MHIYTSWIHDKFQNGIPFESINNKSIDPMEDSKAPGVEFHVWSFEFSSDSPRSNGILDQMEFLRQSNGNKNNGVGDGIYWNWETVGEAWQYISCNVDNNEIELIGLWRRLMRQSYRGWFYGICFIAWWNEGEGWITVVPRGIS